jgi:hypothetical protein
MMIIKRSDLGAVGLIISLIIHFQIYLLLFVMQWGAFSVRKLSTKIKLQQENASGTYKSVELI